MAVNALQFTVAGCGAAKLLVGHYAFAPVTSYRRIDTVNLINHTTVFNHRYGIYW